MFDDFVVVDVVEIEDCDVFVGCVVFVVGDDEIVLFE